MARRTTSRRRTVRRRVRRNPIRSTGMLVVSNPSKRRAAPKRRRAASKRSTVRRNPSTKRSAAARKGARTRRANALKRSRAARKAAATRRRRTTRRNPSARRKAPARRRASSRRKAPVRRRARRSNPAKRRATRVIYRTRRKNPAKRRRTKRATRRNSALTSFLPGVQRSLRKIPVIGPIAASALAIVPPAAFGALSVEPNLWLARLIGPYLPAGLSAGWLYIASGLLLGGVIKTYGGKLVTQSTADAFAIAAASGAGAVGYYKMRTGTDTDIASEMGLLEYAGVGNLGALVVGPSLGGLIGPGTAGYSDGMAYTVQPYGAAIYGQ